jgi:hypothetical protein
MMIPTPQKVFKFLLLAFAFILCARIATAQTCGLAPIGMTLLDQNGVPLSGGFVFTYQSNTTTPATAYSDSTCSTPLPNPVPLNASGQPFAGSGGVTGIYLTTSLVYTLVLQNSSMVTQWTLNGISGWAGGGGSSTNYWTLTGTSIANNNGGGTGSVSVGSNFSVGGNVFVVGGLNLQSAMSASAYAIITAPACMGTTTPSCSNTSYTWRWPGTDIAGVLTSDGLGNLSFQPGGGGGGGAVGPTGALQLSNGSGGFTNNANLNFNAGTQTLVITSAGPTDAGVIVTGGYMQSDIGFDAVNNASPTTPLSYNAFNASTGGGSALSWTAANYVESGSSAGPPSGTTGESGFPHPGTIYCDTTSSPCTEKLWNGSAWVALASGGATSPGGSNCNIQINIAGSFGGVPNLCWDTVGGNTFLYVQPTSAGQAGIDVSGGFAQADYGFYVSSGTNPSWNNINVPTGGVYAKGTYILSYAGTGTSSGPPTPITGQPGFSGTSGLGTLYCDTSSTPCVEKLWNGSAWTALGGGSGGVAGPNTSIQYNNAGVQAGSANLTFASNVLNITGSLQISSATSINTSNQFVGAGGVNVANTVVGTEHQGSNTGTNLTFANTNGNFEVNGNGLVSVLGLNNNSSSAPISVTANSNSNSINTVGGITANVFANNTSTFGVGSTGNATMNNLVANGTGTVTGTLTAVAGITISNSTGSALSVNGGISTNTLGSTSPALTVDGTNIIDDLGEYLGPPVGSRPTSINVQGAINAQGTITSTAGIGTNGNGNVDISPLGTGIVQIQGNNGVTCSGTPTSSFHSIGGIITHC